MISLSEIDTTTKRACKAMGFSWGIAEEVGKNMRNMELFGLPGVKNLNEYFKIYPNKQYQKISLISENNISDKIPYCPIILGTNFLDQISILEEMNEIKFNNVAYPLIFLPFVSRASEIVGKRIHLRIDENHFLLCFNNLIYSNNLVSTIIDNCKNIDLKFIENQNSFTENEWNELYKLSENTFLEETDSLKQTAAGAGLSDND